MLRRRVRAAIGAAILLGLSSLPATAAAQAPSPWAQAAYRPIQRSAEGETVLLTGRDLTIDQLVRIARYGAKVQWSPEARARMADQHGLLLQAPVEGVPVYWYTRAAGAQRETTLFEGDPLRADNRAFLEATQMRSYLNGARAGEGPEVGEEEVVRAMMAARANAMVYDGPSPQLAQMLIDLINHQVTPVVKSLGTTSEADVAQLANVGATMVAAGEAYHRGVRMPAGEALKRAGLAPIKPFAADVNVLTSSVAYSTAQAALLVHDTRQMLEWADVVYAMDLNAMNSSVTPLTAPAQNYRPFRWLNWEAARVLDMIRGSYLFNGDYRIIQDPESLRASYTRQGAAWEAWARLRQAVLTQLNTSDHSPAVRVGLRPEDSWELSTPHMMKYYVKGGPNSGGKGGYIISNANFDPYPLANDIEAMTNALANMAVAFTQRHGRFTNPFFTIDRAADVLGPQRMAQAGNAGGNAEWTVAGLMQQVQALQDPVTPEGNVQIGNVEDLQAQSALKAARARQALEFTTAILGYDLVSAAYWLDIRRVQDPNRQFGRAPTAAWQAFRKVWPFLADPDQRGPYNVGTVALRFLKTTPASSVYPGGPPMPVSDAEALRAAQAP